jgi:uncharacterized protein (DUF58 family)
MLIPAPPLLWTVGALLVLAIAASFVPALDRVLAAAVVLLFAAALIDALRLLREAPPRLRRRVPHALALGAETAISIEIGNLGARPLPLQVFDHVPTALSFEALPQSLLIGVGEAAALDYKVRAESRGEHRYAICELRLASAWRLWSRRLRCELPDQVRVYPNFAALTRFALLATDHRLSQLGLLLRRRRGEGLDFHQLREYREGDAPRQIDWKASSRMRRLISREYREERDQQIILLVDCGRRMAARDGPLSHLDHALNAALLLAFVALRQGDAVGLMTMGGVERWMAPRKSRPALDALLEGCFDLHETLASPDYRACATALLQRQTRRALVVLLSNVRDEDDDDMRDALALLRRRHRVVLASLREPIIEDALHANVDGLDAALAHAASAEYLQRRARSFARFAHLAICLDVEPVDLPMALVHRYLDLKREGAL